MWLCETKRIGFSIEESSPKKTQEVIDCELKNSLPKQQEYFINYKLL